MTPQDFVELLALVRRRKRQFPHWRWGQAYSNAWFDWASNHNLPYKEVPDDSRSVLHGRKSWPISRLALGKLRH